MATSIVTIESPDKIVACGADGKTQQVINVKNTSGRVLQVGLKLVVDAPAKEDWLQVEGPAEQKLDANALSQVRVKIQVAPDCPPGRYNYRLLVFSTRSPGEEFTEGETVAFEVPEREVKSVPGPDPGCSWCIPAAIIAGVVLLGGLLTWMLWPEAEPVPVPQPVAQVTVPNNLNGKSLDVVLPIITRAGFNFNSANLKFKITADNRTVGKVVGQQPPGGSKAAKGSEIVLWVGKSRTGVVLTAPVAKQLQLTQPIIYKKLINLQPRSIEPAPE